MKTSVAIAATIMFVATAAIRILALVGFPNDHFLYLAPAQQMLAGEWPSRDFVDPGTPLMYAVSAVAGRFVGPLLLAEALVVAAAFGLAAAVTVCAACAASGSLAIAVTLALAETAMFPRSYHYPKLLAMAVAIPLLWRYARSPSLSRAAVVAGWTIVAFLFRHDLGVYTGLAALLTAAMIRDRWKTRIRRVAQIAGLIVLFALPYLFYLESTSGLSSHFAAGLAYSREEAGRTLVAPPSFDAVSWLSDDNALAALFYTLHLLPILVLFVLTADARRRRERARNAVGARYDPTQPALAGRSAPRTAMMMAPVAFLAAAANFAFLRDPLRERLADAAAPACILGAWLVARAWHAQGRRRMAGRIVVIVAAVVVAIGINAFGHPAEQIDRAGLTFRPGLLMEHARERVAELQAPLAPRQFPSRVIHALVPFLEYVGRCTAPDQRLFVAGSAPEVYVFARRRFAGGQPMLRSGFFGTVADQRRLVLRMREQNVPLALVLTDGDADQFAIVMAELEAEFVPATEYVIDEEDKILVRVNRRLRASHTDAATGLPCWAG
jgi:hypothetical protein